MKHPATYSKPQVGLHWGIALLMVVSYFTSDAAGGAFRAAMRGTGEAPSPVALVHIWVGVAILVLALTRLALRFGRGVPVEVQTGGALMARVAMAGHVALYVAMILVPVAGVAAWFGGIGEAGEAHEVLFNLLAVLVIGHVAAALYHQFVLKDNLLARMR